MPSRPQVMSTENWLQIEHLARSPVADWLRSEHLTLVYRDEPLAQYRVTNQPDQRVFRR